MLKKHSLWLVISFTLIFCASVVDARHIRGHTPGQRPIPEATAEIEKDVGIKLDLTQKSICQPERTHLIRARWELSPKVTGIKRVKLTAMVSDGTILEHIDAGLKGSVKFKINTPRGGTIIVAAGALTDQGNVVGNRIATLIPCIEIPRPEPGQNFVAPPTEPPEPPIAIPGSPIKESHFVHIGGTPEVNNSTRMISIVGTGAVLKLSSWALDSDLVPVHLQDSNNIVGHNGKVHALSPEVTPKLEPVPFISGAIRNGQLWLTTWQLNPNNNDTFLEVDSHGYGNPDIAVKEYAIAHRSVQIGDASFFEVVTPIITDTNRIRFITWAVNKNTGQIFGLQDSGDSSGKTAADSLLSISRLKNAADLTYVVSYKTTDGVLAHQLWEILAPGFPFERGNGASGLDLRGIGAVADAIDQQVNVELNKGGFIVATLKDGDEQMATWDFHKPMFDVLFVPYKVSDNTVDQSSFGFGVDVGDPLTLTDGSDPKVQNGATQKVRAILTDDLWEQIFGVGGGEVVNVFPANEFVSVGIASVTKVMTLLLAVEAINNGDVSLDDVVEVSANAAATGGSSMNLVTGEKQTLRNLMYGMMLVSGNDASVAIAERIAGNEDDFVIMMNNRADDLNLTNTSYNQPAGGGYSTPQDQVTLFRFGWNDPLFREFTTQKLHSACGELTNGDQICHNLQKFNDNGYPGLEGWKNGNIGFHDPDKFNLGVPLCTSCLISQTRRANRAMLVGLQQSGNRWGDTSNLLDFGFRSLLTPDRRGFGLSVVGNAPKDLAIDNITDTLAVTGIIDSQDRLQVCSWSLFTDLGQVDRLNCTTLDFNDLPGDPNVMVTPNKIDSVRISTLLVEGDYVTIHDNNGQIVVRLWRVGPREP